MKKRILKIDISTWNLIPYVNNSFKYNEHRTEYGFLCFKFITED